VISNNANDFPEERQGTGAVQNASRSRESSVVTPAFEVCQSCGAFAFLLIAIVRFYRYLLSPAMRLLFGTSGACRYHPTCSCYAIEAFQRHGAVGGFLLTISRLLRCHPWGSAGYDPVPDHDGGVH